MVCLINTLSQMTEIFRRFSSFFALFMLFTRFCCFLFLERSLGFSGFLSLVFNYECFITVLQRLLSRCGLLSTLMNEDFLDSHCPRLLLKHFQSFVVANRILQFVFYIWFKTCYVKLNVIAIENLLPFLFLNEWF